MPFAFRIEEFSSVVGDVRAFLHAHGERFLVRFQDFEFKVVAKCFANFFAFMDTHEMLVKSRLFTNLCRLAVKLGHVLFRSAVTVFARLAKIA